jgi:hypothetical protein
VIALVLQIYDLAVFRPAGAKNGKTKVELYRSAEGKNAELQLLEMRLYECRFSPRWH